VCGRVTQPAPVWAGEPPLNLDVRRLGKVISAIWSLTVILAGTFHAISAGAACFDPKTPASGPWVSGYEMPVAEEIGLTEVIAIGKVVASRLVVSPEDPESYDATIYTVQIERVLKGRLASQVRLYSSNTTARYWMEIGERHILFLTREWKENRWVADYFVNNCGNSSKLPKGDAIVKQVEAHMRHVSK
jgi:hypothetical protein